MKPDEPVIEGPAARRSGPWRRRIVVVAVILAAASIVQWNRNIGLWVLGRWHHWQTDAAGVNTTQARLLVQKGALLIDVREPEEFEVSHLAGAINVPLAEIQENGLPDGSGPGGPVITYCTIGRRSGIVAKRLNDDGVRAYNLVGGILGVAQAAPDWIEPLPPVRSIHVWSEDYAWLVPPGFSAVTISVGLD